MLYGRFLSTCHRTRFFKVDCPLQNTIRGGYVADMICANATYLCGFHLKDYNSSSPNTHFALNVELAYPLVTTTYIGTRIVINFNMPHKFVRVRRPVLILILPLNVLHKVSAD